MVTSALRAARPRLDPPRKAHVGARLYSSTSRRYEYLLQLADEAAHVFVLVSLSARERLRPIPGVENLITDADTGWCFTRLFGSVLAWRPSTPPPLPPLLSCRTDCGMGAPALGGGHRGIGSHARDFAVWTHSPTARPIPAPKASRSCRARIEILRALTRASDRVGDAAIEAVQRAAAAATSAPSSRSARPSSSDAGVSRDGTTCRVDLPIGDIDVRRSRALRGAGTNRVGVQSRCGGGLTSCFLVVKRTFPLLGIFSRVGGHSSDVNVAARARGLALISAASSFDQALARDARQTREAIRDDRGTEVAAAGRSPGCPACRCSLGDVDVTLSVSSVRRRASNPAADPSRASPSSLASCSRRVRTQRVWKRVAPLDRWGSRASVGLGAREVREPAAL